MSSRPQRQYLAPSQDRMISLVLVILAVLGSSLAGTIPSDTKGCKRDDPKLNECAVKTATKLLPYIIDGVKEYAIPVLEPFEIKSLSLSDKKDNQAVTLSLTLKDAKASGVRNVVIEDSSKLDLKKQTVEINLFFPTMTLDFLYEVEGKVLLLPITGNGNGNITGENLKAKFKSNFKLYKGKDGKDHAELTDSSVDFTVEHVYMHLNNLFNGDKTLGNQMNIFLNENWKELLNEFGPLLKETVRAVVVTVINNAAKRIPQDVLFPK